MPDTTNTEAESIAIWEAISFGVAEGYIRCIIETISITEENPRGWIGDALADQHNNWGYQGIYELLWHISASYI